MLSNNELLDWEKAFKNRDIADDMYRHFDDWIKKNYNCPHCAQGDAGAECDPDWISVAQEGDRIFGLMFLEGEDSIEAASPIDSIICAVAAASYDLCKKHIQDMYPDIEIKDI